MDCLPLAQARALAEKIEGALAPYCARLAIAGSIRRARPHCGDIDLVVLPKSDEDASRLRARCAEGAELVKHGEQYVVFRLQNGFQLDLWIAHPEYEEAGDLFGMGRQVHPCNFGVLLLARTGSAEHNIWIAQEASRRGLHFNPHRGILRRGQVIASAEESDVFAALNLDFIPPERRER